jgi:hypothetical protein
MNPDKYEWMDRGKDSILVEIETKRIVGSVINGYVWEASVEDSGWRCKFTEYYPAKKAVEKQIDINENNNRSFWWLLFIMVMLAVINEWEKLSDYFSRVFNL